MARRHNFSEVADTLPLFVWSATPDGRADYMSRHVADYTGLPPAQLLTGEGLNTLVHPDDRAGLRQAWRDSVANATPFHAEFRARHHSGEYRWHVSQAQPLRDEDGAIERWVGSGLDIEDRKRMEQHAQAMSERLPTTLESITEGFYLLDPQWRFSFVNASAEQLLGRSRDTLLGKVVWDAYAPVVGTHIETQYRHAMASGESTNFIAHYPPLEMWFEIHAFPSREGLAVYFQDITARRNADAHLRLLETAVDRINDIVLITDAEPLDEPGPRIVFANQAFKRHMGYSPEEVIGKTPRMLQGADTSPLQRAHIRDALTRGVPVRAQLTNYTRSGERVELELDIAPIHDDSGQLTHYVSVERNVTERAALDARLQQAQRMESVGQLSGGLAHDFNNLLTVILGNAELLVEQLPAGDPLLDVARMVVDASDRAATLVRRLLAFSRQQTLEPQAVDVAALVDGMEGLLRRSLGEQVNLHVECGNDLPHALADPSQLESALLNLCINARDAMPAGGQLTIRLGQTDAARIQAEGLAAGTYLALEVSDTGSGIAAEDLPRVFEPFFTTKERSGGTGLGLSMVYGFARQSHGHVAIRSTPRVGTCVTLYLPVADVRAIPRVPGLAPTPTARGGSARILVVEDNDLVRNFASLQLRAMGYEVLAAEQGDAALALLEAGERVDLVFTDVVMPGKLSGIDLAHRVRARWPLVPILLTSGFAEDEQDALAHGPYPVLEKPYRPQHLAERIQALLGWAP